ncbi:MAG: hypothetical protein A2023_04020 [Sulfuricurvum sp. GWF2_44_89]|nr:hypothetical protein [Sulfuricurvum sp. RIFOXYD12_FULL_44_77]OHD77615.1 MAG: hypothetical protein A2023_04020 [Sulfuricurvum sp. GWF2_44_89]OHD93833.1 MAG: hypothetical protein A2517_02955 [Sulfuricurvum sp. RIFOXYD12_FULL_44_77]OHD98162.1 MAG: hypothetical protein A2552_08350 [Sulfuricurvum sp. RIFOXYD2_FULL_44_160]
MRSAMAMIELIFAIVIIAISVITIPSMMNVADNASKGMIIDEDILKRMLGEITKVSQSRWDQNSSAPDFSPLQIALGGDLPCTADPLRGAGVYRANPDSSMACSNSEPMMAVATADGNLSLNFGIEQLHNLPYNLEINATGGNIYTIPIEYRVNYVAATMSPINAGVATATWTLGSSATMNPNPAGGVTHLKRIVVRTNNAANPDVDMTLTFFKSNVGKFSE